MMTPTVSNISFFFLQVTPKATVWFSQFFPWVGRDTDLHPGIQILPISNVRFSLENVEGYRFFSTAGTNFVSHREQPLGSVWRDLHVGTQSYLQAWHLVCCGTSMGVMPYIVREITFLLILSPL